MATSYISGSDRGVDFLVVPARVLACAGGILWRGYECAREGLSDVQSLEIYPSGLFHLLPMIFLLLGGIGLPGGAVYIETWRLRSKRWESAVSLAGPAANLVLAVVLSIVLHFAPASGGGIWPGLAFLGLLQVMAAVLNLIPVPPFDGYRVVAPYLDRDVRARIDQASNIIMLAVFFLLWYVPAVYNFFWNLVGWITVQLQIPIQWAQLGYSQFLFWRR